MYQINDIVELSVRSKESVDAIEDVGLATTATPSEILTAMRMVLDGEDEEFGTSPVEEGTSFLDEGEFLPDEIKPSEITETVIEVWPSEKKAKLLSKIPLEAMHVLLTNLYDEPWWHHEPEVLMEDLQNMGRIIDAGGFTRLMALRSILRSPADRIGFYTSYDHFAFLCSSLSGRPVRWGEHDPTPTPLEMALAMYIVGWLRPKEFSPDVMKYIACTCANAGVWCLPDVLAVAQPALLEVFSAHEIPVDYRIITQVRDASARIYDQVKDGVEFEDLDWGTNDLAEYVLAQAHLSTLLDVAIDVAYSKGQEILDRVESMISASKADG